MLYRLIIAAFIIALAVAVSPQGVIADDNAPSQNKEKQKQLDKLGNMKDVSPWKNMDEPKPDTPPNMAGKKRLPRFQLNAEQKQDKGFGDILEFETPPIEYRNGLGNDYSKTKQPGLTKYSNVTLKRGTFEGDLEYLELWKKTFVFEDGRDLRIQEHKPREQETQDK